MNKNGILSFLDGEERILISRVMDLSRRCEKTGTVVYTPFLNPRQLNLVREHCRGDFHIKVNGGWNDAERCMIAFCPYEDDDVVFPFTAIKITTKNGKVFSHRDYLGALLSLGIKREKTGDIIINEGYAVIFCDSAVAEFVLFNLHNIASANVTCEVFDAGESFSFERKYECIDTSVASLRLDCVVAAATGSNREESALLINRGLVSLNYDIAKSVSVHVKSGDVISVRGYGKMKLETDGGTTRKGRIKICVKHFV